MTARKLPLLLLALAMLASACSGGGEAVEGEGLEDAPDDVAAGGGTAGETSAEAGTAAEGEPATGGTIVAAISAEPDQLDPHLTTASPSFTINENVYDTLVQTTTELDFEPALATEWETSEDQLTWTFTLREGVTWHDGAEFTADDVVYSLERVMDEETGAANAFRLATVESVTAPDATTVEIALTDPSPNLLANLSNKGLAIIRQESVEDGTIESNPIGTGPFMFEEYTQGSSIRLSANPDYWGEGPFVEGVEFRFISEPTTAMTAVQTGEVDWTDNIPPQNIESVLSDDTLESGSVPSTDYWYIAYNMEREPFDDPLVREALSYGFDRGSVTEAARFGAATVNQTAIPEQSVWYHEYAPYEHDPEQAQQLLDEAGVTDLSFSILVSDEFPESVQAAQVLEAQWGEIGVQLEIESVEFATWLDRNAASEFDAKLLAWLGNIDPDDFYYSQHHSEGSNNTQNYANPQLDELLDAARIEPNMDERKALYDQVAEIVVDDNSYVYLYNPDIVQAWQPTLTGYEVRADGEIRFNEARLER